MGTPDANISKPEVQEFLRDNAMDGSFRVGISIARHQGTVQARERQEWRAARDRAERARSASVSIQPTQKTMEPAPRRERSHSTSHNPVRGGPVK